jgi:ABC-type antimicrobial peptide transport system permease subunit
MASFGRNPCSVIHPRGTLSTRRVTAHWVVLAAAALTTLVATATVAALAVFADQALPLAVRHDLSVAPGTALSIVGPVSNDATAGTASTLRTAIRQSLGGVRFEFWSGTWSDPLGLVPGSLPARPASTRNGSMPLLEAAALDGITSHAVLVSGRWPAPPTASPVSGSHGVPAVSYEVPAALPASAAALLHLSSGDVLTLKDGISGATISFRITGLFAPRRLSGTAASYWTLNTIPASGSVTQSGYTMYGPLLVSPAAFEPTVSSTGAGTSTRSLTAGGLSALTGTWLAQPDMAKFTAVDMPVISGDVTALQQALVSSSVLGGMQLSTTLPSVLSATASNLSVARSLLVISALQLLVLALAALLAVARLLASQREGETALFTSRGATRWQIALLAVAEVIPLCAAAAAVGALVGIRLVGLVTTAGPLKAAELTGSPARTWFDVIAAAAVVMLIAVAAMLGPVLAGGPAATEARVRRGRQAGIIGATRVGADIALIALAVLAGWQLRRYSAASGSDVTIDPVIVLAPALALAGGTVVTLRLLPAGARAGDRLAGRGRRLIASLAGWQVSRQPLRQGGAALLLVLAVATGTLALAQHASWARSAQDQGLFAAGADARVDTPSSLTPGATGAITNVPGVQHAMAVSVQPGAEPTEILAVDAAQAAATALIRPDQMSVPEATLFGEIMPKSTPAGTPIVVRRDVVTFSSALTVRGNIFCAVAYHGQCLSSGQVPISTNLAGVIDRGLAPVAVTVTVADGTGDMYQLNAGTLPADGREHVLAASLGGADVRYPLRLVQIALSYQMPSSEAAALAFTVSGPSLRGWHASATAPDLQALRSASASGASALPAGNRWQAQGDTATFSFNSGFGQAVNILSCPTSGTCGSGPSESVFAQVVLNAPVTRALAPLPAIATSAFADNNEVGPGSVVQASLNGLQFPVRIVAVVKNFPTVTTSTGALIIDLPAIQQRLVSQGAPPLSVTEWWLATTGREIPRGLSRALPPGSAITGAAEATADLTDDPLSALAQEALLALAVAAAILAITGFWVSIAADVRRRRAENALLAALGLSQRLAALQLCLEKLMLSVPSAVVGLVLGTVVARLLVPAVTLSVAATQPVPPPLTLLDLPQTLPLAAAVAILPALATALVMIRRPDPAADLRAAEAV